MSVKARVADFTTHWDHELRGIFLANPTARRHAVKRRQDLYRSGDGEKNVYFIEKGSIRITAQSAAGRECLLRLQVAGDMFGEDALLGGGLRTETATAREPAVLRQMPAQELLRVLRIRGLCDELMLDFLRRMKGQEQQIADLVTEPSQRRLGKWVLELGRRIGIRDGDELLIPLRISHDEWAAMVGTTRPRVSEFFRDFRNLGLVATTGDRQLNVRVKRLRKYLGEG